jgi:5-methyltetrahydrofolate--homocysteine methyltransferase
VVIGTVEGDIHDIGKDIVTFMLDVNGFEVKDLGVDVPVAKFVEAVKDFQPQVVGLSGFLTLAYDPMKNTVQAMRDAGFTGKVMIGGGQIDEYIRHYTGADACGKDAVAAVALAKSWTGA